MLRNKFWILLLATHLFLPSVIFSQGKEDAANECPEPDDPEAVTLFKKSQDKKKYEYAERIKFLEKAYELAPNYAPVCYELGMHWQRRADETEGSCKKCEQYFYSTILNCPKYHSNPYFFLGKIYFEQEKYDSCVVYMKRFLNFKEDDVKKYDKLRYNRFVVDAKHYIQWAKFYKETLGSPVPYDPHVVEGISTTRDEYLPFISPDNEIAFFTRRIKIQSTDVSWDMSRDKELFCYSERGKDGKFSAGQPMPTPPFNTHFNEGGASITIDNKHLYYTVVEDNGNYDIYTSDFIDGDWQKPRSVGNVINNPDYWDSQPSISADGRILYFASNRPGGLGGIDLWKAEKDANGTWQAPINLGPNINTPGDEKSPFLHWDSKTLYFSSGDNEMAATTHMNLGGFDIFYARMDSVGKWMKPKNIGYPINTAGNDLGFFVSSDGKYGYFASNDNQKTLGKGVGGYDIYDFELPKQVRPDEVAIIKGKVTSNEGNNIVTEVELKDAVTKKVTKAVVDSITGEYAVAANVQKKHDQLLIIKKDGYAFSSQLISVRDSSIVAVTNKDENVTEISQVPNPAKTISNSQTKVNQKVSANNTNPFAISPVLKIDMTTDSVQAGKAFTLNNIYFGQNRSDLKNESTIVLDEFADYLKTNPKIIIEIAGYTDNVGSDQDNQNLSADRAYTVLEYLRSHGVPREQIAGHKGYGKSKPVAPNDTEEGRAKNRRTEFIIIRN